MLEGGALFSVGLVVEENCRIRKKAIMRRRDIFLLGTPQDDIAEAPRPMPSHKKPKAGVVLSGIDEYTGPFGTEQAAHLLRRTTFGMQRETVEQFAALSMAEAVDVLLADQPAPSPPIDPNTGTTWVNQARNSSLEGSYARYLKTWWLGLMIEQQPSIVEKMTLFWHNFLANNNSTVADSRYMYKQNVLFRQYALGDIKDLIREITKDPAMLVFLNGNSNTNTRPNENYGRELQELFTIGKGPEIAPGNYTWYTEADVQAASKVLTGWRDVSSTVTTSFTSSRHDTTNKQFSSAYQNAVIQGRSGDTAGDMELNDLLSMIFSQEETSKYFCRKLYMWFVSSKIDDTVETEVIAPLAAVMRQNNFMLKPVLEVLLKSEHFYDAVVIGGMIKNPVDFVVGLAQRLPLAIPSSASTAYTALNALLGRAAAFEMELLEPPGVAGWEPYYQAPAYYKLWLNSVTLPLRNDLTDRIVNNSNAYGFTFNFDALAYITTIVANPGVASNIVDGCSADLFVFDLTDNQRSHLVDDVFLDNQTAQQWADEWAAYVQNPTTSRANAIRTRMRRLLRVMLRMAEFQLM